jgi:hypothetical protein
MLSSDVIATGRRAQPPNGSAKRRVRATVCRRNY